MGRTYDQYCPLARALDVVGDRWAMLILRELFFSAKRFSEIEDRLEGIAPNLLSKRLKELEASGLVLKRRLPPPAATSVYELTEKARGLEKAMLELAKWGIQFLGTHRREEAFQMEWLVLALEDFADREAARGVWETYEFRIDGAAFWVEVADGEVRVHPGPADGNVDLLVETDLETFMAVGFGTITPEQARASGRSRAVGDEAMIERAVDILAPARMMSRLAPA